MCLAECFSGYDSRAMFVAFQDQPVTFFIQSLEVCQRSAGWFGREVHASVALGLIRVRLYRGRWADTAAGLHFVPRDVDGPVDWSVDSGSGSLALQLLLLK